MNFRKLLCVLLATVLFSFAGCSTVTELPDDSQTELDLPEKPDSDLAMKDESDEAAKNDNEPNNEPNDETNDEIKEENKEESGEPDVKKTYSVLFIGNSYTYTNDVPSIFKKFADAAGYDVEITSITNGGHTLEKMADPTDTYGAQVDKALKGTKKYDYVILQEQSARPAGSKVGLFYNAVRNLVARIRESGAIPILYSTWGRATGSSTLTDNGWTNESMTWKLAAAYSAIGEELNVTVAHVGLAFFDIYNGQSEIDIYSSDKSHPSYAGSYLAAATLFAKIFDEDPSEYNFRVSLRANQAAELRQAAARAVFQTPSIPEEYKTTSEGIGS